MCNKHKSKKRKYHSTLSCHIYWCGNDEKEIKLSNSTKIKIISLDAQEMAIVNEMTK